MKHRTNWQVPLLGTALVALLAISGCGATGGFSGGFNGFVSQNGQNGNNNNNNNNNGGGGGQNQVAAPFLMVGNTGNSSLAEFGINSGTGALTPVNFNAAGAGGVENNVTVGAVPNCVASINLGVSSAVYVGTGTNISAFTTDNSTGFLSANATTPTVNTGGQVTSMLIVQNGLGSAFLYAAVTGVGAGQILSFTINVDGSLTATTGVPTTTTGVNNPGQLVTATVGGIPFVYCLNKGNNSVAAFSVVLAALNGFQPGNLAPSVNGGNNFTTGSTGISTPQSMTLGNVLGVNLLLIANGGGADSVTALAIGDEGVLSTTTTGAPGALAANQDAGASVGLAVTGITAPTSVAADPLTGSVFVVTNSLNLESFTITPNAGGAAAIFTPNTGVTFVTGAANTTTTGISVPDAAQIFDSAGTSFVYVTNGGGGTGSIAVFTLDTGTGALTATPAVQNPVTGLPVGTANTQTTGIDIPALNPQDANIVTGI